MPNMSTYSNKVLKELAFLELAKKHLMMPKAEVNFAKKYIIAFGHEFSPVFWERIASKISGSKFVDGVGYDLENGSEMKTSSTREYYPPNGYISRRGQISNVGVKTGYICVACFNITKGSIDYFRIPPDNECQKQTYKGMQSIPFRYKKDDTYGNSLELYRVKNEIECCNIPIIKTKKQKNLDIVAN